MVTEARDFKRSFPEHDWLLSLGFPLSRPLQRRAPGWGNPGAAQHGQVPSQHRHRLSPTMGEKELRETQPGSVLPLLALFGSVGKQST